MSLRPGLWALGTIHQNPEGRAGRVLQQQMPCGRLVSAVPEERSLIHTEIGVSLSRETLLFPPEKRGMEAERGGPLVLP